MYACSNNLKTQYYSTIEPRRDHTSWYSDYSPWEQDVKYDLRAGVSSSCIRFFISLCKATVIDTSIEEIAPVNSLTTSLNYLLFANLF